MPRLYHVNTVERIDSDKRDTLGIRFAKLAMNGRIPTTYLSRYLGVSRQTIHTWFLGGEMRTHAFINAVEALVGHMEKDLKQGVLPKATLKEAREYLENLTRP